MTEGQASISGDVLARYARDAACDVDGVRGLASRRAVRVDGDGRVELRLDVAWGSPIPTLGRRVQDHVREYLGQMAQIEVSTVEVVVDRVGPPK